MGRLGKKGASIVEHFENNKVDLINGKTISFVASNDGC